MGPSFIPSHLCEFSGYIKQRFGINCSTANYVGVYIWLFIFKENFHFMTEHQMNRTAGTPTFVEDCKTFNSFRNWRYRGTEVQRVRRSTRRSTGGTCLWASPPRPSSSSSSRPRTGRPRPGAVCRHRPSPRTRPRTGRSRSPHRCWATGRCWRRPAPTPRQSSRN